MSEPRAASARAALLGLEPHPEGGWFRRTWTASDRLDVPGAGERPAASLILFLLEQGEGSAWHVVRSDEIWLWHGPDPVILELGGTGTAPATESTIVLGGAPDQAPQGIVPAGVWQRALPVAGSALVSCVVSPGFSFDDWRLAPGVEPRG